MVDILPQIFLIVCLFGELWMFFVIGAFVFLNQYLVVYIRGKHDWQVNQRRALSIHSSFEESNEDLSDVSHTCTHACTYILSNWMIVPCFLLVLTAHGFHPGTVFSLVWHPVCPMKPCFLLQLSDFTDLEDEVESQVGNFAHPCTH